MVIPILQLYPGIDMLVRGVAWVWFYFFCILTWLYKRFVLKYYCAGQANVIANKGSSIPFQKINFNFPKFLVNGKTSAVQFHRNIFHWKFLLAV